MKELNNNTGDILLETEHDIRGSMVDKSQEIAELKSELNSIQEKIVEKIELIDETKTKLNTGYRHRDREKYEVERREISEDLLQYEIEMKRIKDKIRDLEARQ